MAVNRAWQPMIPWTHGYPRVARAWSSVPRPRANIVCRPSDNRRDALTPCRARAPSTISRLSSRFLTSNIVSAATDVHRTWWRDQARLGGAGGSNEGLTTERSVLANLYPRAEIPSFASSTLEAVDYQWTLGRAWRLREQGVLVLSRASRAQSGHRVHDLRKVTMGEALDEGGRARWQDLRDFKRARWTMPRPCLPPNINPLCTLRACGGGGTVAVAIQGYLGFVSRPATCGP